MAFFRKKKGEATRSRSSSVSLKQQGASVANYPAETLTITSLVSPASFDGSTMTTHSAAKSGKRQNSKRWTTTPRNTKTPSTVESSLFGGGGSRNSSTTVSSILGSLNVVATDDIEISTLESQQALVQQREAIRRQLFDPPDANTADTTTTTTTTPRSRSLASPKSRGIRSVLYRTATNASQEILPNGSIVPDTPAANNITPGKLSADQASLPLTSVSQSFESHDEDIMVLPKSSRSYDDSLARSPAFLERSQTDPLRRNVSPNTSHGSRPMDERRVDQELEYQRNKGKSPLKGMPDDERMEYQRDEIDAKLPERNDNDDDASVDSLQDEEYSVTPSTKQTGLVAGGALMAAAVGWGVNAVDQACIGDDDLEDEDTIREAPSSATNHRPRYLSETECKKFLRRITRNGFVLLNLITDGESWTGRTVTMCIAKGSQEHPAQLEWTTITGGQNHEISVSSVDLMDILTIDTDGIPEDMEEEDTPGGDNCIFTITTDDGNVFLFESNSREERDRIVNGLKTIIARWARQMVAGEVSATSELYAVYNTPKIAVYRELAVSPSLAYTMNSMAHRLLDL